MKNCKHCIIALLVILCVQQVTAQNKVDIKCEALHVAASQVAIKPDVISEDDPNDLAEAYSYLIAYFPGGTTPDNQLELRFPARVAAYHWQQQDDKDKNDSLSAQVAYIYNQQGHSFFNAYASDFTITVTRYDAAVNGSIQGTFKGTMQTYGEDGTTLVPVQVSGSFSTRRTGTGDECRKGRRDEKALLLNAKNIIQARLYQPIQNLGWVIQYQDTIVDGRGLVANSPAPYRPLMLCGSFLSAKIAADPNSDYTQKLTDSITYYSGLMEKNANDDKLLLMAMQNMSRVQKMLSWQVKFNENDPYIKMPGILGDKGNYTVLHIPGAGYAYRVHHQTSEAMSTPEDYTVLLFGNWPGADMNNNAGYVNYPFVHKQHAAVLENFTVTITAPPQLADDIIKAVDWKTLNAAIKL